MLRCHGESLSAPKCFTATESNLKFHFCLFALYFSIATSIYSCAVGCCPSGAHGPGCRYDGPDGGPGDPFEWSEFGANAISVRACDEGLVALKISHCALATVTE